jgi:membrane-associated progesterone receptor component
MIASILCATIAVALGEQSEEAEPSAPFEQVPETESEDKDLWQWFIEELTGSPINVVLLLIICFLIYKLLKPESDVGAPIEVAPTLEPMKKRDFTPRQLKPFDGKVSEDNPDGRILIGVLGKVYDMTKGKSFYGPGGPYSVFAGRDASRALATFDVHSTSEEYDDLSDLKQSELNEVKEWDLQFSEKYTLVGKLLKPGEQPTSYSDDEGTDDEAAIEEENRKLKRLSSGQKLPKDDQEEEIQND